ncbi:MAG: bifunctional 5,10-methylenetetrahydrofolate dehydrogenase/5,10-methenyltetrahydrofolate cyclohydrolase, partial [Candidatus Eisenbacteria sp.]|nr:bifunctional 5,10-methylenetetrahydrofolate dehydrogenase/5,10-methenyltetrahydrofolate cyclohydrolase [Candidatus Eisenbacteria bacterium]
YYSASIERAAAKVGVVTRLVELDPSIGSETVARAIRELSQDTLVHGIIVQQPLPVGIPPAVVEQIVPGKDVDCASTYSLGLLMTGREVFAPCTALAVLEMLHGHDIALPGKHVVIVGRSTVVGKPLANLLLRKSERGNATVTVCHTGTSDLTLHTRQADILVAAMGRPGAIRGDMISEGAVVVDVGVNQIDDPSSKKGYRLVGDVAFDEMTGLASAVTPVPGGVGTLTTALLLRSVVVAAEDASTL